MEDIPVAAANMRLADKKEAWALAKDMPTRALLKAFRQSDEVYSGWADNTLLCMFGVTPANLLKHSGIVWMLSTKDLPEHSRGFLRHSRHWIADVRTRWPLLWNYVDCRYTEALRWVEWLGFQMGETINMGPFNKPFQRMELRTV